MLPFWFMMTSQIYTVISWIRGEQSNYCPEVVEKIWDTVARGRRGRATVSQIFSITDGQWFDCSPSSLEITVLLPNCFKSPKHCQQYADTRRWRREIWRYVTSFVTWPVNSGYVGPEDKMLPEAEGRGQHFVWRSNISYVARIPSQ